MTEADKAALAAAMNKQTDRQIRAMSIPYFWIGSGMSGESGQFSNRDLQLARAEREEMRGRD